jgi:hypothetical protein
MKKENLDGRINLHIDLLVKPILQMLKYIMISGKKEKEEINPLFYLFLHRYLDN